MITLNPYDWSQEKQLILFPENLKVICYIAYQEKLFSVQIHENKSREQSTFAGNSALLLSLIIDFAMLPAQRFFLGKSFIVRCHVTSM